MRATSVPLQRSTVLWGGIALAALLHLATAGVPDIYDELPGQYAATAWETIESGTWLVPTLEGVPRLQKPPLVYWMTAASLRLLGRSEFAARLPTALALTGVMVVIVAIARRLDGEVSAFAAATIFGTSLGTVLLGKLVMPEPFFTLGVALTYLAVLRVVDDPARRRGWSLAAWVASAFACLTKGLHGLLLPAVSIALVAVWDPASRRPLAALARPLGPALFLALVLPWPLYIELHFPGFLRDNVLNEQLGHVLDTHVPRDSESTPLVTFWAQHLLWWFPWILFAGAALRRRSSARHPLAALPAAWLLTTAVGVSLAGQRQDYYLMMAWPAFAILVARAWSDPPRPGARPRALGVPLAVLTALGIVGLGVWALSWHDPIALGAATAPFAERNSTAGALSGIAPRDGRRLWPLLLPASVGLILGGGGGLLMLSRRAGAWSWVPVAAGMTAPMLAAIVGLQAFAPHFGLKAIGLALGRETTGRAFVVFDGPSHRASSLGFYAEVDVRWLERPETEFAVRSRGIGRERFVTTDDVVRRWRAGEPAWLITEERDLGRWRAELRDDVELVARSGTRVLVTNPSAGVGRGLPSMPRAKSSE